jgi:hypothetical protein
MVSSDRFSSSLQPKAKILVLATVELTSLVEESATDVAALVLACLPRRSLNESLHK